MRVNSFQICLLLISAYLLLPIFPHPIAAFSVAGVDSGGNGSVPVSDGPTVRKDERWPLVSSEFGEISAVRVSDGGNGSYYLQFITLNPNALFLPVYLHSHMLFYVTSGSGTLGWINIEKDGGNLNEVMLQRGDIYGLSPKTIFYLKNDVQKLEIYAIFPNSEVELEDAQIGVGAYIGVPDLVLGFDDQVLQSTLGVSEEVIKELRGAERQPLIVEGEAGVNTNIQGGLGSWGTRALLGIKNNIFMVENNKKASNIFNIDREVDNCFGWAVTVSRKDSDALKHTDFGVFMVNLSKGSMMAPHWNPKTDEISIVVQGAGMIQVVCPGIANETGCKNSRYIVQEGDVFVVPRYHAMVQTSFNNDTFVSVGFKLALKKERSQYLIGKFSILKMLDRTMLQKSFNVTSTTIDLILSPKKREVILECTSCAEEEEAAMEREEVEQEEGGGGESPEGGGGESPEEGGGGDGGGGGGGGGGETPEGGGGESPEEGGGGEGGAGETPEGGGDGESPDGGGGESPEEGGGGGGGGGGGETPEGEGGESPEEGGGGKGGAGETPEGEGGESPEEGGEGEPSEGGGESPRGGGGESPEEGSGAEGGGELPGEGGGGGSGGGGESPKEGGGGESPEEGGGGGESHEEGGGGEGEGRGESQEEGGGGGGGGESPKEVGRGGGAGKWELPGEGGSGGGESPQEGGAGGRGGWDLPEERGGGDRGWLPFEGDDGGAKLPEERDRGGVEVQKEGRGGGGRSDLPGRGGEGDSRGELPTEGGGGGVLLGGGLALKEGRSGSGGGFLEGEAGGGHPY